jgi:methyltransferase (TIGR00027 family)
MPKLAAIKSAETVAALRALVSDETRLAVACRDPMARHFLSTRNRILNRMPRALTRRLVQHRAPGSYGFAIVRTRHFDDVLRAELAAGIEQVVLLGAGYDSRAFRFSRELKGVRVFEIDHPGTQARKRRILEGLGTPIPTNIAFLPIDFTQTSFPNALAGAGFDLARKTLFLWEGVSYYLPQAVVKGVLDYVAACAPGSSILFDYATRGFVDGDTSTYGGREVARWLERIREPFLFGLDATETAPFVARSGLRLLSDLGPQEQEALYLQTRNGVLLGRTFGHVRIAHAGR